MIPLDKQNDIARLEYVEGEVYTVIRTVDGTDYLVLGAPHQVHGDMANGQGVLCSTEGGTEMFVYFNPAHVVFIRDAALVCKANLKAAHPSLLVKGYPTYATTRWPFAGEAHR